MSIMNQEEFNEQLSKQPPLAMLDIGIWLSITLLGFCGDGILTYLIAKAAHGIPELAPNAVAVQPNIAVIWCFPAFFLLLPLALSAPIQISHRYALFGRKGAVSPVYGSDRRTGGCGQKGPQRTTGLDYPGYCTGCEPVCFSPGHLWTGCPDVRPTSPSSRTRISSA